MRREELEHQLRSAAIIAERRDVLVLGSQAILGTYDEDELPVATTMSVEADLAFFDADHDERQLHGKRWHFRWWPRQDSNLRHKV